MIIVNRNLPCVVSSRNRQFPTEVPYIPGTPIQSDETEEFDAVLRQIKPDCKNLLEELKEGMLKQSHPEFSLENSLYGFVENSHIHFSRPEPFRQFLIECGAVRQFHITRQMQGAFSEDIRI